MTRRRCLAAWSLALAPGGPRRAQAARPAAAGATLIKNATVLTVTKGTLQNTDLLLQNGKIARIGQSLQAPAGATWSTPRASS
jgi:hypothetical protein